MAAGLARAGWREPMGGGAGRAGRPGWGGARTAATVARARGRWLWGSPHPAPPSLQRASRLGAAGEEPQPRRGTARFAEGVKCLKYGGGSERPRNPQPPPAAPQPSPPRPDPRSPPRGGWKLERKPESCPLRTPGVSPSSDPGGVALMGVGGGTTPRRPAGSSLTEKKFARLGADLLHLLREVAEGRQGSEPHLVWQPPPCRDREKNVKGAFPFVSKRKSLFSLAERKSRKSVLFSFFRHLDMSDSETDLSAP